MKAADALMLVVEKLRAWLAAFILMLPNLIVALLVVAFFGLGSRLVDRGAGRLLRRISHNEAINTLVRKTMAVGVVLVGLLIGLSVLNLEKTVTSLLAGVGVIGIALGFAFQDIAANFMSGIIISLQHPCDVGDLIKTGAFTGKVERIALRSTWVRTFQGPLAILPNKDILQSPLINFSRGGQRRMEIRVGVSYNDDLEKVRRIAADAVRPMRCRVADRDVEVHFEEFADSSINFVLWMWIDYREERDYVVARSEAILRLKKAFDAAGITIPYPIRTLDFEVKVGDALAKALASLYVADAKDPRGAWALSGKAAAEGADVGAGPGDDPVPPPEAGAEDAPEAG